MAKTATPAIAADLDTSGAANVAPAETFSPSGAPHQVTAFDPEHPAVDNDPRASTTADMNRIDFNDPVLTGAEIAQQQLQAAKKAAKKA
jgi:hypothetical protein